MNDATVAVVGPGRAVRVVRVVRAPLAMATAITALACAQPPGSLVIVQNQLPVYDSDRRSCAVPTDSAPGILSSGKFDVLLDKAYPYWIYPLIASRLPSLMTMGGVERNAIMLRAVRVNVKAPAGIDPGWDDRCPGTFDWLASAAIDPLASTSVAVQGFQECHATRIRQLIMAGVIPADLSQPVYFTLDLTAVADRSGSQLLSDVFPFPVRVCAGCLQEMYPLTPDCTAAPKPNPSPGNPCNIAQDGPNVLCCVDPSGALICPAPST